MNEKRNLVKRGGKVSFIIPYVLRSIKQKRRSIAIVIGFIIGVAMVSAIFTWTETGSVIFSKDHLERSFQIVLTKPLTDDWYVDPVFLLFYHPKFQYTIWETYNLLQNDSFVSRVEAVYSTKCLFNTENKSDSFLWFPKPEKPILIGSVFMANDSFLKIIQDELGLENVSLGNNGVLVSRSFAHQLEVKLGISIKVGSNISFAIATRIPKTSEGEITLKYWERVFFENLTVKGIYDWVNPNSFVSRSLHTYWHADSLFMPLSLVNSTVREALESDAPTLERRPGPPKLFVQLNADEVVRRDIMNLEREIEKLRTRVSYPIENEISFSWDTEQISRFIDAYYRSRTLLIYILPVVDLSACVVIFSSEVTFGRRRREAGILRARGADSRQLYILFIAEFLILALIGTAVGFTFGVLLGCLIPSTTGLFQYDSATFNKFLAHIEISPYSYFVSFIVCVMIPLLYAFGKARSYSSTDIATTLSSRMESRTESLRYIMGAWEIEVKGLHIRYVFFLLMLVSLLFVRWLVNLSSLSMSSSLFLFIILLSHWSVFAYATALAIDKALPMLSKVFTLVLGPKGKLVVLDLKRKKFFTSMITVLILASSIMTFSLVEAETAQNNLKNQVRYAIGCDLRIVTAYEVPWSFAQNLTKIPGISKVTPVLYYRVVFGSHVINLIGVDPTVYEDIGFWTPTSFVHPTYERALELLAENPNGTVISSFVADALKLDLNSQIRITKLVHNRIVNYNLTVLGIMRSAPGFGDANPTSELVKGSFGFHEESKFFIVNKDFLISKGVTATNLFFASVDEETDVKGIIDTLLEMPEIEAVYSLETFDLGKVDIYRFLYMQGVTGSLDIQFLITVAIGIVSLAFFLEYMISERSVEYAVMRALGATRKDIKALIFIECILVISLSLIAGLLLGMVYSTLLFDLLLQIFPFKSVVPYVIAMPILPIGAGFGLIFIIALLGIHLSTKKAEKTDIAGILRNL